MLGSHMLLQNVSALHVVVRTQNFPVRELTLRYSGSIQVSSLHLSTLTYAI